MSSIVVVHAHGGFVISTDTIVITGTSGWKVKGGTHKLFQVADDILAGAVGTWNSFFPALNDVARLRGISTYQRVGELRRACRPLLDSRVCILYRLDDKAHCDVVESGHVDEDRPGIISFPERKLNELFLAMYESDPAKDIRNGGLLGVAALIHAYNAFAESLCSDISGPFDTALFLPDGQFLFSGGIARLPVAVFA